MAMELPPWLTRDYDPVGTFMRAYQTGAQISEAQTRLAEQQRQANMEAQARQEQLQQQALHDLVNVQVTKAYHDQQIALDQAQLKDAKERAIAQQNAAADRIAETVRHNQMMEELGRIRAQEPTLKLQQQQTFVDEYDKALKEGKDAPTATREALKKSPSLITPTTVGIFSDKPNRGDDVMRRQIALREQGALMRALTTNRAKQREEGVEASKAEELKKQEEDLARQYTASVAPWTNAPAAAASAPAAVPTPQSQYKVGGVYRKGNQRLRYLGGDPANESSWEEVK